MTRDRTDQEPTRNEQDDSDSFVLSLGGLGGSDEGLAEIAELLDHVLANGSTRSIGPSDDRLRDIDVRSHVGRFEVKEEIGRGGFGVVYRAYDTVLERDVALKAIPRRKTDAIDEASRLSEARATANMNHPYLVPLYEAMEDESCIYLISELCPGQTLTDLLLEHPEGIPPQWAAEIASKLAAAVAHAHRRGFVHRDIKPSNVLLVPDREQDDEIASEGTKGGDSKGRESASRIRPLPFTPRLTDFGLVRDIMDSIQSRERGKIVGTLAYIAPEQLITEQLAHGASLELKLGDVYSLGVVIYQMLAGSVPFRSSSPVELIELMTNYDPPPLRTINPRVDRDLEAICLKCLHRDPGQRYESIQSLSDDLERYRGGFPVRARPQSHTEQLWALIRRSPVEASLLTGLVAMSIVAALTFAWSNHSLRRQSESLAVAVQVASKNVMLAKQAESRAGKALLEAEDARRKAEASESAALEIAYQSDMRQAFDAVAAGDTANSLSIADDILEYSDADQVKNRLDWRLLKTFASRGWQTLPKGSADDSSPITEIRIVPQRNWIASTSRNGWVRLHDKGHRLIAEWKLEQQGLFGMREQVEVHALAASADGRWLAVGKSVASSFSNWSGATSVEVVDLGDNENDVRNATQLPVKQSITGFDATVESLAFSPDSKKIAVGTRYEPVDIIDLDAPDQRFRAPSVRRNENIFFTEKGDLVWVASPYHLDVMDLKTREPRFLVSQLHNHSLAVMAATSDASKVFCTFPSSNRVYVFDTDEEAPFRYRIECPYGTISAIALSPDEKLLVFGTAGGGVGAWNLDDFREETIPAEQANLEEPFLLSAEPIQYHVRHRGPVLSLVVESAGRVYSGGEDGALTVSNIGDSATITTPDSASVADSISTVTDTTVLRSLQGADSAGAAMTEDGRRLFLMASDGTVFRHNLDTGQVRIEIPGNDVYGSWLSISDNQQWLIAGDYSGRLILKEMAGDERVFDCSPPKLAPDDNQAVRQVQFNDSGDRFIVSQEGNLLHWFSLKSDSEPQGSADVISIDYAGMVHLRRGKDAVFFTSEDKLLLIGDYISRYQLGDVAEIDLGPGIVFIESACEDPTGERFLVGTLDGRIHVVDHAGRLEQTSRQWRSNESAIDRHHDISCLTISSDGQTVLSGSTNGVIGVWNAENLRYLGSVTPSADLRRITGLTVSSDSRWMLFHCRGQSSTFNQWDAKFYSVPLGSD